MSGFLIIFPKTANSLITLIIDFAEPERSEYKGKFTIENVVFNRYKLFDIDFFNYSEKSSNVNETLKRSIATWYYSLRNIAVVGSLIILIYIGIRMAISTTSTDKSKYKKMIIAWIKGFVLIFTLQYIAIALIEAQNWALDFIGKFVQGEGFEEQLIKNIDEEILNARGWNSVPVTIQYYVLVYFQIVFFITYMKRFFKVGFLFVIAPLVTITYAVDAVGDGKAQGFSSWLKELAFSIFIQSLHACVYTVFIFSAGEIAKASPVMGALLLFSLSRTEKIAKKSLKMGGSGISDESLISRIKSFRK